MTITPRDFALLLLGSRDRLPRQRARSPLPDRAGLALQHQILSRLAAIDPDAESLNAALAQIVAELGPPTGPTRALALSLREDWQTARDNPSWLAHLLQQAALADDEDQQHGRRLHP